MSCFNLVRAVMMKQQAGGENSLCLSCVYFNRNIDASQLPSQDAVLIDGPCSLSFGPGSGGCAEMRTNNCSARKTNHLDTDKKNELRRKSESKALIRISRVA
ncbi:MAG TPA: hypothetical protein DCO77_04610 [Nitrospiraceae bacterium]|nr:hypothetical protein [Nitrospiraceae bacterium]